MLRPRLRHGLLSALLLLGAGFASRAEAIKLVNHNLLFYPNQSATRDPHFRTIYTQIPNKDLVTVQEVATDAALQAFQVNVLNNLEPGAWLRVPLIETAGSSIEQGILYRASTMTLVEADTIGNLPRAFPWARFRINPYTGSGAELIVVVVHLKAGNSTQERADRVVECTRIRGFMNQQAPGTHMLVTGDFNFYTSAEGGYTQLTGSQADNDGQVHDPIDMPGAWQDDPAFALIHTQSTRTTALGDGGATGGLDDRFDLILTTAGLDDGERLDEMSSTYHTFGNDGLHLNNDINDPPVIPQGQAVADALQRASDHMPVVMEFEVPARIGVAASLPFGTVIVGAAAQQPLTVTNIAVVPGDELDYSYGAPAGFTAPGGTFEEPVGGGGNQDTITMLTASAGVMGGNLSVTSDDVDTPVVQVALSGTVLRHAVPSLDAAAVVTADSASFGTHNAGDFSNQQVSVYNRGHDALQSDLRVTGASITGGDGRFSLAGGFSPVVVEGAAATFMVAFDDTGATDTTYTATLTFNTADEAIPGGLSQSDLVVTLTATVSGGQNGVEALPFSGLTVLRGAFPNPFHGSATVRFDLAQAGSVSLFVVDVQGRSVRTLLRGEREPGPYHVTWDGRGNDGRDLAPGFYYLMLDAGGRRTARSAVKLR